MERPKRAKYQQKMLRKRKKKFVWSSKSQTMLRETASEYKLFFLSYTSAHINVIINK